MRIFFLTLILFIFSIPFSAQEIVKSKKDSLAAIPKNSGKISHAFKAKGIPVVIQISTSEGDIILIPKTPLPKELDINGLEIKFDYRILRAPSPRACPKGHQAVITNCSKK